MMIGFRLFQLSSLNIMSNLNAVKLGKLSIKNFQNTAMSYFIAAILLIIPGVFSDFLGLISLIYAFYLQFMAKIVPEQKNTYFKTQGDDNVIDVEIID